MGDDDKQVGDNVRTLRTAAGLSQGGLAEAMRDKGFQHWRQTTVSRVERGAQTVKIGETRALETLLAGNILKGSALDDTRKRSMRAADQAMVRARLDVVEAALRESLSELQETRELLGFPPLGEGLTDGDE